MKPLFVWQQLIFNDLADIFLAYFSSSCWASWLKAYEMCLWKRFLKYRRQIELQTVKNEKRRELQITKERRTEDYLNRIAWNAAFIAEE